MRPPALALATLLLALPGCLNAESGESPVATNATSGGLVVGDRPDPTFGNVTTGPSAGLDDEATLDAPPRLVPGEWWRIQFESPLDGSKVEYVRVVAAVDGDQYLIGMPHEGWYKEAVIYHAPAFGDVNMDLSYNTHDELFTPLKFPLKDGDTWTTTFSGRGEMTATVKTNPEEKTATVTFTAPNNGPLGLGVNGDGEPTTVMELVYDAKIHEVREFTDFVSVTYKVVDHGYGYEGWVTIPRGEDLVFFNGRFGPGIDINGFRPAPPTETVEIAGGFNRVTFIQIVGDVFGNPGGAYREKAISPDGKEYVTESVPGTGDLVIQFFEHANPDGVWQFEHVAGGPGLVFTEGIAYHQYDIRLPDGLRRSDHSHEVVR